MVSAMNILMISPFDLVVKRLWGPTIRLHSLAKELDKMGHNVILAGPPPFHGERPARLDGVNLYYFKKPFHRYYYPPDGKEAERKKHNRRFLIPLIMFGRLLEIMKLIKRNRIEVLYVNRAFLESAYPCFAAHIFKRIPIIYDWDDLEGLHGFTTSFRQPLWLQLFETFNEVLFTRIADATVVASNYLRDFALRLGTDINNIFYVPTVADSDKFHPDIDGSEIRTRYGMKDKKVLFYCGNLMENNGVKVENILYTLNILLKKEASFVLLIVGNGDLLEKNGGKGKLRELADVLGISEHVVFTGGIPYSVVPLYLAASDLCLALFPVNVITMAKSPLKVYEYMAAGKPVIARDVGELSFSIIDGETGLVVYSDNPEEYAEKILDAFSSDGLLNSIGENARRLIEDRFNWKKSADIVINACEHVLIKYK
jgi:glycosyltransferase involved in cell wall biosynthesis